MYIDLIEQITEQDKQTMINYIDCFGVKKENFIGLNEWLQPWSHSNQKLYKLLGNKLIREFKFKYEKPEQVLRSEIIEKLMNSDFKTSYHKFYEDYIAANKLELIPEQKKFFNHLLDTKNFENDKIYYGIKYKTPTAKKMLQIQAGAKPLRAISRVIDYFKDIYTFKGYDDFRVKHSLIMNDKVINGTICISIHPLDFMTMSDNASNWQSCMSWVYNGCYRVGTIEMMNSNNVVCAYLKNTSSPFVFTHPATEEVKGEWVNKAWRQLFYINKDIIMSGKAYPYIQEDITRFILNTLKDLAKENMNWNYEFGIEPYKDMIHVNSLYRMEKQREWIYAKSQVKNNIIWDTNGMYNDMLNDNTYPFLCYRNKVKHTKIYSASGKCNCLQCGGSVIEFDEDEMDYYNDRYRNVGAVLCRDCYDSYEVCDCCDSYSPVMNIHTIEVDNEYIGLCDRCINKRIKLCPCCGKPMYITWNYETFCYSPQNYVKYKNASSSETIEDYFYTISPMERKLKHLNESLEEDIEAVEIIYLCKNCQKDLISQDNEVLRKKGILPLMRHTRWDGKKIYYLLDPQKYENWRYHNLKNGDYSSNLLKTA